MKVDNSSYSSQVAPQTAADPAHSYNYNTQASWQNYHVRSSNLFIYVNPLLAGLVIQLNNIKGEFNAKNFLHRTPMDISSNGINIRVTIHQPKSQFQTFVTSKDL